MPYEMTIYRSWLDNSKRRMIPNHSNLSPCKPNLSSGTADDNRTVMCSRYKCWKMPGLLGTYHFANVFPHVNKRMNLGLFKKVLFEQVVKKKFQFLARLFNPLCSTSQYLLFHFSITIVHILESENSILLQVFYKKKGIVLWQDPLNPQNKIQKAKSRKYQGVFEMKSRVKTWQVRGILSQQLEH